MATLYGTITLGQVTGLAILVAHHLDFNMSGLLDQLFHIHPSVAKGSLGLFYGTFKVSLHFVLAPNGPHSLTTTSGSGLDHNGIAHFFGRLLGIGQILQESVRSRYTGYACRLHGRFGSGLIAHAVYLLRRGPNELDIVLRTYLGELGVFRKETITGMNGVRIGDFCRRNNIRYL